MCVQKSFPVRTKVIPIDKKGRKSRTVVTESLPSLSAFHIEPDEMEVSNSEEWLSSFIDHTLSKGKRRTCICSWGALFKEENTSHFADACDVALQCGRTAMTRKVTKRIEVIRSLWLLWLSITYEYVPYCYSMMSLAPGVMWCVVDYHVDSGV